MKKIFHYALLFAAVGMMGMGFTSCSSDDPEDNTVEASASTLENIVGQYVNDVVNPTYRDLQAAAATLDDACKNLYAKRQTHNLINHIGIAAVLARAVEAANGRHVGGREVIVLIIAAQRQQFVFLPRDVDIDVELHVFLLYRRDA